MPLEESSCVWVAQLQDLLGRNVVYVCSDTSRQWEQQKLRFRKEPRRRAICTPAEDTSELTINPGQRTGPVVGDVDALQTIEGSKLSSKREVYSS